jgi:hypothetical protein
MTESAFLLKIFQKHATPHQPVSTEEYYTFCQHEASAYWRQAKLLTHILVRVYSRFQYSPPEDIPGMVVPQIRVCV